MIISFLRANLNHAAPCEVFIAFAIRVWGQKYETAAAMVGDSSEIQWRYSNKKSWQWKIDIQSQSEHMNFTRNHQNSSRSWGWCTLGVGSLVLPHKNTMYFWIWSRTFTYARTQVLENVWKILSALVCLGSDCPHHVALEPSVFHYRFFGFWDTAAFLGFLKRFRKLQNALCLKLACKHQKSQQQCPPCQKRSVFSKTLWDLCLVFRISLQRLWPWSKLRTCLPFVNHALRPLLVSLGFQLIDFKCSLVALVGESCVNRARNTWLELPMAGYHFRYCLWMQVLSKCSDDCVVPVILSRNEVVFMKSGHRNETSTTYQEVSKNLAISTTFTDSTATCDGSLSWQTQALVQKAMWTKDWCLKDRKAREQRCFFFVFKHVGQMFF